MSKSPRSSATPQSSSKATADRPNHHSSSDDEGDKPVEIFQYDAEGRRFLAVFDSLAPGDDKNELIYTLPNDDEEMDRLHLQHYLMRYAFQGGFDCMAKGNVCFTFSAASMLAR